MAQNYPNPLNPATMISFELPGTEITTLTVFNIMGQKVATLVNERLESGSYQIQFDASALSNGVYFYKLEAGELVSIKKMMLIK